MKKFLLFMLGALIALPGIARDFTYEYKGQTLTYTVLDKNAKTCQTKAGYNEWVSGNSVQGTLEIPAVAKDGDVEYTVTTIGKYAFYGSKELKSVIIPNSVTTICEYAFYECDIKNFTVQDGETELIFEGQVLSSDLHNMYIGRNWSNYENMSIASTARYVIIGNNVTTIPDYAFYKVNINSLLIGKSVRKIGKDAFKDIKLNWLSKFAYPSSVSRPISEGVGIKYPAKDAIIENGIVYGPDKTSILFVQTDYFGEFLIPSSVTTIGEYAFKDCNGLTSVFIPASVTTIGNDAFKDADFNLQKFAYPSSLSNPVGAVGIEYPAEDAIIENGIVYGPDKTSILFVPMSLQGKYDIPNSVTSIGKRAFCGCSGLTSIDVPNSVTSIGERAFYRCSGLTSIDVPNSVTTIGYRVFEKCSSLISVDIPNSVTTIGFGAFSECSSLTSVIIPNSVTTIGYRAFAACYKLTSVIIPNSVTTIGAEAFSECSSLTSVTIGNSVTSIDENAFKGCSGLTSITASGTTPPVIDDTSFKGLYATAILNVPDKAASYYLATNWSLFENLQAGNLNETAGTYETGNLKYRLVPATTTDGINLAVVIPGDYSPLTEVTIPERFTVSENGENTRYYVDGIGYKAFNECSNLNTVTFNSRNASKTIGDYAFAGTKISTIAIPTTVETIGKHAFDGCSSLTAVTIPASVKTIDDYAFYYTNSLTKVTLNEGLETIGDCAFNQQNKRAVEAIYIPSTVKSIGAYAFYNFKTKRVDISDIAKWADIDFGNFGANPLHNSRELYLNSEAITDLKVPAGVAEIKSYAFYNCSLNSVTFPEGLNSIGIQAFYKCSALESVTFPAGLQTIGDEAFCMCEKLGSVAFREGLQTIGSGAFYSTNLQTITIPGTVNYIGAKAFTASAPTLTFEYGNSPVETAVNSFKAPTSLSLDRPVESLNFDLSSLQSLNIGNSVAEIPAGKFKGTSSLTSLTLGSGLKTIGDEAFIGCTALTEVIVPPSVESIGASAFSGNTGLTSIIMGHSVDKIGENAFYQCPAQTVSITAQTPPAAPDNAFSNYTGKLYVQGQTAAKAYSDADFCWYQFESHVMIEPTEFKVDGNGKIEGKPGDTFQLTATLYPRDVTLPYIFWRSTNPDIASVDDNGLVTLHADMSDVMAAAEGDDTSATCKIIAESLYADGPVAEWTVTNDASGIDDVTSDGTTTGDIDFTAPVEIYNLQGVMVGDSMDNLATGIYIVRQGNLVKKIAVK